MLDDYPQRVKVVNARRSRSEACVLMIFAGIKIVFYPIQYDLEYGFGDCGQDTYFSPIISNLSITRFWNFHNDTIGPWVEVLQ